MKIRYKAPYVIDFDHVGEWVDLRTIQQENMSKDDDRLLSLGIAMELPEEFEAIVAPRSSTFKRYGIMLNNSIGIIDSSFKGDSDIWRFPVHATRNCTIPPFARIAQFRIQLSQKASAWTKIKWMFTSKIEFVKVYSLGNEDRGGIGSTGV
mgnify:CR=1 FL=1